MSVEILSDSSRRRLLQEFVEITTIITTPVSSALNVSTAVTSGVLKTSLIADGIAVSSLTAPSIVYIEAEGSDTHVGGNTTNTRETSTPTEASIDFSGLWVIGLITFGSTVAVFGCVCVLICCFCFHSHGEDVISQKPSI